MYHVFWIPCVWLCMVAVYSQGAEINRFILSKNKRKTHPNNLPRGWAVDNVFDFHANRTTIGGVILPMFDIQLDMLPHFYIPNLDRPTA